MNNPIDNAEHLDDCLACGEPAAVADDRWLPLCDDCLRAELPRLLVRTVPCGPEEDCGMCALADALKDFETAYWRAATEHVLAGRDEEPDDDCDRCLSDECPGEEACPSA